MRQIVAVAVAAGFLVAGWETASAEIYRWTDSGGREHFTTDLGRVPPQYRPRPRRTTPPPARAAPAAVARPAAGPAAAASSSPAGGSPPAGDADLRDGHNRRWWRAQRARLAHEVQSLEQGAQVCHAPGNEPCSVIQVKLNAMRGQLARFEDRALRNRVPRAWLR